MQIPKKSLFQIYIQYNNYNNYYYSDYIEASSNLLGHIKLYYSLTNSIASQLNINNDNLLFLNRNLLLYFKADMKLLNPFLEKYKPSNNNNIFISDIISALKIFSENKCTPLFLKDLYFKKIYFPSYLNLKLEDNSMFINLNNILLQSKIKDDKNNEARRNILNNLLCIYGFIYYKYNKEKFSELIKNEDIFSFYIKINRF